LLPGAAARQRTPWLVVDFGAQVVLECASSAPDVAEPQGAALPCRRDHDLVELWGSLSRPHGIDLHRESCRAAPGISDFPAATWMFCSAIAFCTSTAVRRARELVRIEPHRIE